MSLSRKARSNDIDFEADLLQNLWRCHLALVGLP